MSGLVKSIGKTFKRLGSNKWVKGIAIAAAAYYVGGLVSGNYGVDSAVDDFNAGTPGVGDAGAFDQGGSTGFGGTVPIDSGFDAVATGAFDMEGSTPDLSQAYAPQPPPMAEAAPSAPSAPAAPAAPSVPAASSPPSAGTPSAPSVGEGAKPFAQPGGSLKLGDSDKGLLSGAAKWFKDLSPGAQAVIAGGVSGGIGAVMSALAQKNALEDAREREDRAREDIKRRGHIEAFGTNAYTPKTGIINSARG